QASFNLTGIGEPERFKGGRVSANLFNLLGVEPQLGRGFRPEEDQPGTRVVILGYGMWQRRFAADASIIGRIINLNGQPYTVIGVMPRTFEGIPSFDNWKDQLWVPIAFTSEEAAQRGNHFLEVLARLKSGVSRQTAQAAMDTIAATLAQQYPDYNTCNAVT